MRRAESGPSVWCMTPDPFEAALAAEVLAEASRKRLSHKHIQLAADIPPKTWSNYFVQNRNHIPMAAVFRVSRVLGVSASELIARAEAQVAEAEPVNELESGLSAAGRREIAGEREKRDVQA